MNEDFVSFELAKKLKEKGFSCKHPFAMYNESGDFCELFTSADVDYSVKTSFGYFRHVYDYDDFGPEDFMAPTIAQVLKWLREKHKFHIIVGLDMFLKYEWLIQRIDRKEAYLSSHFNNNRDTYEQAALAGIEYVLDKLL